MKQKKLSFEIRRDENAAPIGRYMVRVVVGGVCVQCPRFAFEGEAWKSIEGLRKEYAPNQKNVKVEINL